MAKTRRCSGYENEYSLKVESNMRNKIAGAIGAIWGGSMVVSWLFSSRPVNMNTSYQAGNDAAVIFGLLMMLAGIYSFFKKTS